MSGKVNSVQTTSLFKIAGGTLIPWCLKCRHWQTIFTELNGHWWYRPWTHYFYSWANRHQKRTKHWLAHIKVTLYIDCPCVLQTHHTGRSRGWEIEKVKQEVGEMVQRIVCRKWQLEGLSINTLCMRWWQPQDTQYFLCERDESPLKRFDTTGKQGWSSSYHTYRTIVLHRWQKQEIRIVSPFLANWLNVKAN